ncbi:hypothetical protein HK102_009040 [Quaeritorhiza haematococci]|nr:hypothetical protein HK102_009040 [Quaeritorhiza haematococci]
MSSSILRRHSIYGTEDRIVLDIGSLFIKCGFSGEPKPRHIIPIQKPIPDATAPEGCRATGKWRPLYQLQLDTPEQDLENLLLLLLRSIYHNYLLTDPKQRKVILCENPLLPVAVKKVIIKVLFENLQVPSITFIPTHLLSLLSMGRNTGLVVDCGYLETSVLPIFDGRPLIHKIQTIPLAGQAVTNRLKTMLVNHASLVLETGERAPLTQSFVDSLPLELIENIKTQLCFVGHYPTLAHLADQSAEGVDLPYKVFTSLASPAIFTVDADTKISIPGWLRERAAEVLFEGDDDGNSIATCILEAILVCPADLRTELAQNVLLVGGTSMMTGFRQRLYEQLLQLVEENKRYLKLRRLQMRIRFLRSVFVPNIASWIGGSLMGAIRTNGPELVRVNYEKNPNIPDWSKLPESA